MTLNLTGARDAITSIFQHRTLRIQRDLEEFTERCGFSPRGGAVERGSEGRDQERGEYTLTLPALSTLELQPDEEFRIDEIPLRLFRVVWAPPPSNLNLSRRYGASEVR